MDIIIGKSYWNKRLGMKVRVYSVDRPYLYIVEDVRGDLYLAFEDELQEI